MEGKNINYTDFLGNTAITSIPEEITSDVGFSKRESAERGNCGDVKVVKTCCRACIGKCGVLAYVKNGRVVKLAGDPENPMSKGSMCAKGLSGIQALYHPDRNKYPLLRVGERGENKWKRISWDEAIDIIAQKLMEVREKYGPEGLICSTGGGGNPEFFSSGRFCNTYGTPNWFEPGSSQCYMPRTMSYRLMYGKANAMYSTTSIADSECEELYFPDDTPIKTLVMWGTAPSYNSPPMGGRVVVDLRAGGVKTVVVDPRFTPDAAKADVWLPIRPGTDVALMLAWIRYIIENRLYDEEIVMKWSNLPFLVNPQTQLCLRESDVMEGGDPDAYMIWDENTKSAKQLKFPWDDKLSPALEGTHTVGTMECKTGFQLLKERVEPYTLEKAADICWLEADMIEKSVKLYAENTPSGLSLGVATDQTINATAAAMGAATLDLMMGNVQKPGALLQNFKDIGHSDYSITPLRSFLSEEQLKKRLGLIEHKGMLHWGIAHNPSVLDAIVTGKPYRPRVWLERSGNKLATIANPQQWVEAMGGMDFIVHMYMYPTSFSSHADMLLPATEWLETEGTFVSLNKVVVRQAVTHTWETLNETEFWMRLGKKMADLGHKGFKDAFDAEKTAPEPPYTLTLRELIDNKCKKSIGMTFEQLIEKSPYEVMPEDEWRQYYHYKMIDPDTGKPNGFGTPSKRLEIYGEAFVTLGRTGAPFSPYPLPPASKDYDPLPCYLEPDESPIEQCELSNDFPLVMTNGRLPYTHHSTLRNVPWIRELYPVPEIWIHPETAGKYSIEQGDWVWVESKRGKICAKAFVTEGINPGVVYMERFWNPETLNTKTGGWREMNVNILSKGSAPYDDVCGTTVLRGYLVRVSKKADGPPEGVWTKPEDFKAWLPQPSEYTGEVV